MCDLTLVCVSGSCLVTLLQQLSFTRPDELTMDTYMALGKGNWEGRGGVTPRYMSTGAGRLKEQLDSQKRKRKKYDC